MPGEVIQRPDWGSANSLERGVAGDALPAVSDLRDSAAGTIIGGVAAANVAAIENSLFADEYQALDASLSELPESILAVLREELSLRPDNKAPLVSDDIVSRFRADPAGEVLAGEWLWRTPEKIAVFHQRLKRIMDGLLPSDREAAIAWTERRTVPETVAIVSMLAGER